MKVAAEAVLAALVQRDTVRFIDPALRPALSAHNTMWHPEHGWSVEEPNVIHPSWRTKHTYAHPLAAHFAALRAPRTTMPKRACRSYRAWILVHLHAEQWERLLGCLGLHDLYFALKSSLSAGLRRALNSALSMEQESYLKAMSEECVEFAYPSPHGAIRAWIQRVALHRIGRALYGTPEYVVWHLAHTLDRERGEWLMHCAQTETSLLTQERLWTEIEKVCGLLFGGSI